MILLLGGTGLLGSEISRELKIINQPFVASSSKEVDLTNRDFAFDYIRKVRPTTIILCSALVGGVYANKQQPSRFLSNNVQIYTNVLDAAATFGIDRVIFIGSSVIYPKESESPIKTDYLLSGLLDKDMQYFAIAKISGIKLLEAYRIQGFNNWISVIFTNLYGINDNRNASLSHVIPSLIMRLDKATKENCKQIEIRGSASSRREFLYAEDAAKAISLLIRNPESVSGMVNVGSGTSTRIDELVALIADSTGYRGEFVFEMSGASVPPTIVDSSEILGLGWFPQTRLAEGITKVYNEWKVRKWI